MSYKSWFWALEDAGGSWSVFSIFGLIWIWSLVFCTTMFWDFALYLVFEGVKNYDVLKVLIGGFWGCWWFLTWVWHLHLDLDMVILHWYNHVPNVGYLSWFWRCKEHTCILSPHLGLWRTMEVSVWGLASWSWFAYICWCLIHQWSKFLISILNLEVQKTSMSFKSSLGALEDAGGSWLGFTSWSWFGYGH